MDGLKKEVVGACYSSFSWPDTVFRGRTRRERTGSDEDDGQATVLKDNQRPTRAGAIMVL
jgi:hypothetical protein